MKKKRPNTGCVLSFLSNSKSAKQRTLVTESESVIARGEGARKDGKTDDKGAGDGRSAHHLA